MASRSSARLLPIPDDAGDDHVAGSRTDERSLRALFEYAQALIRALQSGAGAAVLAPCVREYVDCAGAQGISSARIRDALEYLVRAHAPPDEGHSPVPAGRGDGRGQRVAMVLRMSGLRDPGAPTRR